MQVYLVERAGEEAAVDWGVHRWRAAATELIVPPRGGAAVVSRQTAQTQVFDGSGQGCGMKNEQPASTLPRGNVPAVH